MFADADVGVALNAVSDAAVDPLIPEIPISAALVPAAVANAGALVGAALNAVMPVDVLPVNADTPKSAAVVPVDATKAGSVAGAPVNAVSAPEVVAVNADPPISPPELIAPALVGVALKAVRADEPVINDAAAARDPELRFVTAEAVRLELAFAP